MRYRKNLVLFTLFAMNLVDQPAPEVEIEQGIVSGIVSGDGSRLEYIGIPYGVANSSNRFQAPFPPPKWDGIYKATQEYACPQSTKFGVLGSEDCLKVNVYIPAMGRTPLPVMVYIHGGAFIVGSGGKLVYGPDFIVKKDVILVTLNYRLGALGFTCLGIQEAPGNAGLKDQIAALRWVKKNIAAFGGDPDNITVFGESAGGTSVSILYASEATEGLFNRAIVQSGSVLSNWGLNRKPVWIASLLAKAIGHDTEDPHELYEILSKLDYKELVQINATKQLEKYFDTQLLHLPCIEKQIPGEEAVLNDLPYNLFKNKPKNIPIIYGSNSKEGLFLVGESVVPDNKSYEEKNEMYLFASDLEFPDENEAEAVDKKLKEFYFKSEYITANNKFQVADLFTHLYFEVPEILESELILSSTNTTVYNYIFNYSGGRNFLKHRMGFTDQTGSCHGDELLYLFTSLIWPYPISERDRVMIDWMTTIWTNFAKYGDPTPSSSTNPIKWTPSTKEDLKFLYFEDELRMGQMPNPEAYGLWKDIYVKYRRKNVKDYY